MKELIKKFTDKKIIDFSSMVQLDAEFYLFDKKLNQIKDKINKTPVLMGAYLGRQDKPSLFLLQELAKHAKNKVWVNEKGEWLFICKRNLLQESITKSSEGIKEDDFVLVLNQHEECLGYGKMDKNKIVKRVFDIGDFLRRERKSK
jgi:ribosome biogenesis protein Nip4